MSADDIAGYLSALITVYSLIIVVGLGLIALGIFTAAGRIFGTPV